MTVIPAPKLIPEAVAPVKCRPWIDTEMVAPLNPLEGLTPLRDGAAGVGLGEGKAVGLGEGEIVGLGEGEALALGEGEEVAMGEGEGVALVEGTGDGVTLVAAAGEGVPGLDVLEGSTLGVDDTARVSGDVAGGLGAATEEMGGGADGSISDFVTQAVKRRERVTITIAIYQKILGIIIFLSTCSQYNRFVLASQLL